MASITADFRKIENLLNRAFVLLKHISVILMVLQRDRFSTKAANAKVLANILHICYGYLKALQSLFGEFVQVNEATKQHIREFESNLNSSLDGSSIGAKPYHSLDELEAYFKRKCLQEAKTEEEKLKRIRETLHEEFIKFHPGMGSSLLSSIADPYRQVFQQQGLRNESERETMYKLENEYIAYTKKFAGVIEAMYRLL